MKKGTLVWSAEIPAVWRAAESAKPQNQRVCNDSLAADFLSKNPLVRKVVLLFVERRMPGARPAMAARTRYIDDHLIACISDDIQQLVNLGAGFDSRAYRFAELEQKVKVFEVDHPVTQKAKMRKVKKIVGSLPRHVVYVPIDFEKETLDKRLLENGYDKELKTLFIGEAIAHHLTAKEVDSTLDFIVSNSGVGSSVIFDYIFQSVHDGTHEWEGTKKWQKAFRRGDENRPFGIPEGTAEDFLSKRGFQEVTDVGGEFLKNTYFKGTDQGKEMFCLWGIAHATVKPKESPKLTVHST